VKSYDPFTYTLTLKPHQAISEGEIIDDNGVKLKVLQLKRVARKINGITVEMTVREIGGNSNGKHK
jgi:hypothetical protein